MRDYGPVIRAEQMRNAARLWQEHLDAGFPADPRGAEFEDIDMVLLDADTAGCVYTWPDNGGALPAGSVRRSGLFRSRW
ncbi:hypothetical protein [Streptomyces radiopugnans]|uniref:hypothetical protein n=1 Tax=Streptomyces radiopugnans TaxID=403935 RepID=UPI003F1B4AF2